jgi:glycosyltransferase involved in cell wall biosynthesis
MKILHIFSNWKWTGPAEHALNMAVAHTKSGHDVTFACAPPPPEDRENSIVAASERAGIPPVTKFKLNKHFNLTDNIKDIPALRRYLKEEKFDVVHTHLPNDHFLCGMALFAVSTKTVLIRTCYDGHKMPGGFKTRLLLSCMTDGLITISNLTKNHIKENYGFADKNLWKVDVPVDLERFNPDKVNDIREKYHLVKEAMIGGIVARVQKHRRFEVLLEAIQIVTNQFPAFKFMIIGRGTHIEEIAIKPSQKMGIRTNIIFTGYKREDFCETLSCLNFKIFLVPGSDGSCRAVREAMAMGTPVIAAKRGILPELIADGTDGLVVEDTPENIAEAIMLLVDNPELCREMGKNARTKTLELFNLEKQAAKVIKIYEEIISRRAENKKPGKP